MLRTYQHNSNHLMLVPAGELAVEGAFGPPVWLDLFHPTPDEDHLVEKLLGIDLPTREEMQEIEVSARLYQEDGAEFMTETYAKAK